MSGARADATPERARRQLSALARVSALFERDGIEYWLFGGWAVDFYAGRVTREHDDLDLAVWLADLPRISKLLEGDGWVHAPEPDEDGGTGYENGGVRLELTYLVRDDRGSVFTPLRGGRAAWSGDALAADAAELLGVRARIVGLASLTSGKERARDDPEDAAKDRADARVLAQLTRGRDV
ncbi:MAG TPA: nucleotidyltransferase family protein [Gaiellaceae bacterium]|jgi:hypothetical protein|nr:nucleotidyltransferase family protein [Gaiellaceae bacterium]